MKITKTTSAGGPSGSSAVAAILADPAAMQALASGIANQLMQSSFGSSLISAVESVANTNSAGAAGTRMAGVVSSLVLNASNQPYIAITALGGSATAVTCYVPPHLAPFIAAGQEVWVEAVNGNMHDLLIVAIRNISTLVTAFLAAFTATSAVLSGSLTAGSLSSDGGAITSDGSGDLTLKTLAFSGSKTILGISYFSGTGTGTYNHNLGTTPTLVIPVEAASGGTTSSFAYDTPTSTQVHVTMSTTNNFVAIAIKFA